MSSDHDWQLWGERDPYFGVLTQERFRRGELTDDAYQDFFRLGREQARTILADSRHYLGEVSTRHTLEFGCGVGRLLIPFSELSELCVGVDVSDAMRAEAACNCVRFERRNVSLVKTLGEALAHERRFTFVYSYIVLQHIDAHQGLAAIRALLGCLEAGGCAAVHVTYGHSKYPGSLGEPTPARRCLQRIRRRFSRMRRRIRGRDPQMQMNAYSLNRVLFIAQQQGVRAAGVRLTDHSGHLGAMLYFKREPPLQSTMSL